MGGVGGGGGGGGRGGGGGLLKGKNVFPLRTDPFPDGIICPVIVPILLRYMILYLL